MLSDNIFPRLIKDFMPFSVWQLQWPAELDHRSLDSEMGGHLGGWTAGLRAGAEGAGVAISNCGTIY